MMLNLQIALEYLLHFIVIQWIYEKTSLVKIPRMILPIAFLVECIGGILGMSYNVGLSFMTPFYLLFYAYFYGKEEHQYVGILCLLSSCSLSFDF